MTRGQAIEQLVGVWEQATQDRCVGMAEIEASNSEMREVLRALGVTDDELAIY